jgi:hypothetical protein
MEGTRPDPKPTRPRGRPKKADAPVIDWPAVDKALVFGEVAKDPRTGREALKFPSLAELAKRNGVSPNRMWQYASKHRCFQRRAEAQARVQERFEEKVIEKISEARALEAADLIKVVDAYIAGFGKAVADGKVRCDSPADFDRLVRLRELLSGNADSRQELQGGLTLEGIQARHARQRTQLDGLTAELAGEVTHGDARGRDGQPVH